MINTKALTKISSGILVGLGLITLQQNTSPVLAASSPRVQLRQNSYVYSSKGNRKSKVSLKRGTYLKTYGKKSIKGKVYYNIGNGRYVKKINTVIPPKEDKGPVLFTVYLKYDAEFYTKPNGENSLYTLIGKQNVYETYTDSDGHIWYRLKYHNWVKATDTQKSKPKQDNDDVSTSDNQDNSDDNTGVIVEEEKQNSIPSGTSLDRATIEETAKCFESLVNDWRAQQGVGSKVSYTTKHYDYDVARSIELAQHFDKYQQSDHHAGSKTGGEMICLVTYGSPQKMAESAFNKFVYRDANAGYAHRDHLKMPSLRTFGIGLGVTHFNGDYTNGVCFVVASNI